MSKSGLPSVIGGYSSVEALRRANKNSDGPKLMGSRTALPATEGKSDSSIKPVPKSSSTRIGHTILPHKFEITCYQCQYAFVLPGHIHDTICPKCKENLRVTDRVIEGECSETIKTIGNIEVKPGAILKGADIVAMDIILAGDASEGIIQATRCLELCQGGKFDTENTKINDLKVRSEAKIRLTRKIACRNINIEGKLNAKIYTEGMVTVKPGGLLQGEIHGPHLIVEEGGGLKAKVVVGLEKSLFDDSQPAEPVAL